MKKNRVTTYLKALALVALGIVIGIGLRHYYHIPLIDTINIIELATLVTTVFLALYIPIVLERKLQIRKDKKDLIKERVEELQDMMRNINIMVQREEKMLQKDFLVLKNTLDLGEHKLETISSLLKFSQIKVPVDTEIKTLNRLCKEHKELLWSVHMEDEGFEYPDGIQEKEEQLYNRIDETTSILMLKLSEV